MQPHCGIVLVLFQALVSLLLRSLFLAIVDEGVILLEVRLAVDLRPKCAALVEGLALLDELLLECDAKGASRYVYFPIEHMRRF